MKKLISKEAALSAEVYSRIKRCAYCPNCGAKMDKDGDGE